MSIPRPLSAAFALLLLAGLAGRALALDLPPELRKRLLAEAGGKSMMESQGDLDNSLDPQRYLVGGGDMFQISIVGLPSMEFNPVVDAEGNLYDGELGIMPVGRLTLAKAKAVIVEKVKRSLRKNNDVYVAIKRIKVASVTIIGPVQSPGTVSLPGNQRILDAIKLANGGYLPSLVSLNFRQVKIRNGDSTRVVDLLRFLSKQDLDQNPYAYPGDVISIDPTDERVYVTGEVREPITGWLPILRGETLGSLMGIVNLKATADSDAVLLQFAGSKSTGEMKAVSMGEARQVVLSHNDIISFGPKESSRRPDTVKVTGEVKRPGTYPIRFGKGSAGELVKLAGGYTDIANWDRVFIMRHRKREAILGYGDNQDRPVGPYPMAPKAPTTLQSVRPEVASSISDLTLSGDFILIDVSGEARNTVLEDGDELHVPRRETHVYVSGNVRKPGAYPYVKGKEFAHYIDKAGGYTSKADSKNQYLLASYNGITQLKGLDALAAGDVIVVPAAVEYKRYTNVFLPIIQIMPGVLSLVVTYLIFTQQKSGN